MRKVLIPTALGLSLMLGACSHKTAQEQVLDELQTIYDGAITRAVDVHWREHDLNGDGKKELMVRLEGPVVCGTGGCPLHIYQLNDGKPVLFSEMSVTRTPIYLMASKTKGPWMDFLIWTSGGGIPTGYRRLGYNAALKKYDVNPTLGELVEFTDELKPQLTPLY